MDEGTGIIEKSVNLCRDWDSTGMPISRSTPPNIKRLDFKALYIAYHVSEVSGVAIVSQCC